MANKVTFPSNQDDKDKLTRQLDELDMSLNDTERLLLNLARLAKSMAKKALDHTDYIFDIDVKRQWRVGFNNDRFLKRWFGEVKSHGKAKNVRNRLEKLYKRIDKGVTMKLKPSTSTSNASNNGWVFTPGGCRSTRPCSRITKRTTSGRRCYCTSLCMCGLRTRRYVVAR